MKTNGRERQALIILLLVLSVVVIGARFTVFNNKISPEATAVPSSAETSAQLDSAERQKSDTTMTKKRHRRVVRAVKPKKEKLNGFEEVSPLQRPVNRRKDG